MDTLRIRARRDTRRGATAYAVRRGAAAAIVGLLSLSCSPEPDAAAVRPRHAVLVVVDTLRADHLGLYGYDRPTSPNLDRWAERSLVFDVAYSSSSWTLPTLGSLLTGTLPVTHAAGARLEARRWKRSRLDDGAPLLAEQLAQAGWATGAVVTSPWLRPRFGLSRGFDDYSYARGRTAEETVSLAIDWVEAAIGRDESFFLFVHLIDPHLPYAAPPPFRSTFAGEIDGWEPRLKDLRDRLAELSEEERAVTIGRYDEEVAYVDRELGRLLDRLDERGFFSTGVLAITSDHGEELFEQGGFEHGHAFGDPVVRVPLLVVGAGIEPGRDSVPTSSIDVAPSLLDLLGLPIPEGMIGSSRFHAADADLGPLLLEGTYYGPPQQAVVDWPYKLIRGRDGSVRLFDLEGDPSESRDLAEEEPATTARLLASLENLRESAPRGRARQAVEVEEEETFEELRSLGYVN